MAKAEGFVEAYGPDVIGENFEFDFFDASTARKG
jgi:hypothetical protein